MDNGNSAFPERLGVTSDLQVVIPCGGSATRLGEIAKDRPKLLVSIHGRPFLFYITKWLLEQGVTRVHFCLGHLSDLIVAELGKLPRSLCVSWTIDPYPCGVAGALRHMRAQLDDVFVLLHGDVIPRFPLSDLVDFFYRHDCEVILSVVSQESSHESGNVMVHRHRVSRYVVDSTVAHAHYLDVGVAVCRRSALDLAPSQKFVTEKLWYQNLCDHNALGAYLVDRPSHEVGSVDGLARFLNAMRGVDFG